MIKGFCGPQTNWYFGVFDGHGMYGHQSSDFAAKNLNQKIIQLVKEKYGKLSVAQALHNKNSEQVDFNYLDEQFVKDVLE